MYCVAVRAGKVGDVVHENTVASATVHEGEVGVQSASVHDDFVATLSPAGHTPTKEYCKRQGGRCNCCYSAWD